MRKSGSCCEAAEAAVRCVTSAMTSASARAARLIPAAVGLVLLLSVAARGDDAVDRFLAHLDEDARLPAQAREVIRSTWAKCDGCDAAEFLTQSLAVIAPAFRAGLDAYDKDDFVACAGSMAEAAASDDPFVKVHARVYEAKALAGAERFWEASERLSGLHTRMAGGDGALDVDEYSHFSAEVDFLRGLCLLADLKYDEAQRSLREFLRLYPNASQRLVVTATQMLNELVQRNEDGIAEVVDLMNYSGRRLRLGTSGDDVQPQQKRIIELLDRLIQEAEQAEQSSQNSGGGGGGGGSGNQGGRSPSNPMQDSSLPGGSGSEGSLREARRATPGEAWGAMPPAERERILQALKDSFPPRYRQLVEQYYEELAKKP